MNNGWRAARVEVSAASAASALSAPAGPVDPDAFAGALLRWFDQHRRDLPWRRRPSPYRTLVSEFMLQQTVVATVRPYFQRFVARFPDFAALAAAPEDQVTALWSGLGYYARARNLRRAAIAVMADHGGVLPGDEPALRALPGVGAYTAAAVAAIAFDRRTFALDGNGIRVLARLFAVRDAVNLPATRAHLQQLGQRLVPAARAGDFNQAMMELGALVCGPRAPACDACPVRGQCAVIAAGLPADALPVKQPRPARRLVAIACAVVERQGRVLLVRRKPGELLAGTWALPSMAVGEDASAAEVARAAATESGIVVAAAPSSSSSSTSSPASSSTIFRGSVRHVFTHRDLSAQIFSVPESAPTTSQTHARDGDRERDPDPHPDRRWVDPRDLAGLGVSSFTRKTLSVFSVGPATIDPPDPSPRRSPRSAGRGR